MEEDFNIVNEIFQCDLERSKGTVLQVGGGLIQRRTSKGVLCPEKGEEDAL